MLVLKKIVHKPGHYQYTIHYEGKSFSCPRTQKWFTSYYMHFSSFKICSQILFSVSHFRHISLPRLLPKSYFKISTFRPNFLCSSSFKSYPQLIRTVHGHDNDYVNNYKTQLIIELFTLLDVWSGNLNWHAAVNLQLWMGKTHVIKCILNIVVCIMSTIFSSILFHFKNIKR